MTPQLDAEFTAEIFTESGTRLPRYRRSSTGAPGMSLMDRDLAVLEDVWRFGLLATSQIETLRAADREPRFRFVSRLTLTRRLQLLFHNRYLRRLQRPHASGSVEPVYVLDSEGARVLSLRHGEVTARVPSRLPKAAALDHLLSVVQFRVSLTASSAVELVEWLPGDKVRFRVELEGPGQRRVGVSIVPDSGAVVRVAGRRHYLFIEVDRGTEPQRTLAGKVRAYAEYWRCGGFASDFSVPRGMGFWVLLVAPSPKRMMTIQKAFEAAGDLRLLFRTCLAGAVTPESVAERMWMDSQGTTPLRFWETR